MKKYYLSIDPGLSGTGWAIWNLNWHLLDSGNVYTNANKLEEKISDIGNRILVYSNIRYTEIKHVWIEYPAVFGGVAGDMVARKGDVVKLTFLAGYIVGHLEAEFTIVPVHRWKGQLPKPIVIKRIKKILPFIDFEKIKSHSWDAIGLGLWAKGRF